MTLKRFGPTAWLEDIINRDYGPIIHELVTNKFKTFVKKFTKPTQSYKFSIEYLKNNSSFTSVSLTHSDYSSESDDIFRRSQSESSEDFLHPIDLRSSSQSIVSNTIEEVSSGASSLSFNETIIPDSSRDEKEELHEGCFNTTLSIRPNLNKTYSFPEQDHSLSIREISDLVSLSSYGSSKSYFCHEKKVKPTRPRNEDISIYEDTINLIYKQERIIQTVQHMMVFGGHNREYVGSIPHIAAAKRLLVANLNKEAFTVSLAKSYYFPSTENVKYPKRQVTISNLLLDTDHVGQYGIPPCLYMVTVQHDTTILHTDIQPPDVCGIVKFETSMMLENVSHEFTLQVSLFKMNLLPRTGGCKPIVKNIMQKIRGLGVPTFQLIGQKQVSMCNIEDTAFPFKNNTLYVNFLSSVETGRKAMRVPMTIKKYVRKNRLQLKPISNLRWGHLEGTNFRVYSSLTEYSEPIEEIDMLKCKCCRTDFSSKNTLIVEYEKPHSSSIMYLKFNDNKTYKEWLVGLNAAMAIGKRWKPTNS